MFLTSRQQWPSDVSMADRDYFRHFVEHDDISPFISAPVESRVTGTPTVYIARRINGPDHTFLGLAVGAIDLQYLADFYRAIGLPPGETVTLLRRDGLVLVRYPGPDRSSWKTDGGGLAMVQPRRWQGGTYRSPGFLGASPAVVSVRPLPAWPLVIDVSMMEPVALAKWRVQATVIALGGLGAAVGFAVLFTVIGRQFRRQAEQNGNSGTAKPCAPARPAYGTSPRCRPTGCGNWTASCA